MADNCKVEKILDKITDKDLPISFTEDRHLEPIEGVDFIDGLAQMWRMKERVSRVTSDNVLINFFYL